MEPPGRILTQREWLGVFAEVFHLLPEELASRVDRQALNAALEAPAAHHRGRPIYLSLAEQATALTVQMLRRPPLPAARRAAAYLTLELFVEHSGGRLFVTTPVREAFMREVETETPSRERLLEWISARLGAERRAETLQTGTGAAPTPVVYVAVPVCAVCSDEGTCEHERTLAEGIEERIRSVALKRGWPGVRIEIPALPYLGGEDPSITVEMDLERFQEEIHRLTEVSPDDGLRRAMLAGLRMADALVILGGELPSFGNGNEFARVSSSTANLYLHRRGTPCSRWLDDEPSFCFLRVRNQTGDLDEVCQHVASWISDRALLIEGSWRRRQLRLLDFGPLAAMFASVWGALPTGRERLEAFAATGLPIGTFHLLLSPDGVATAPIEELAAMCRALGIPLESLFAGERQRTFVLSAAQRTWLVRFAEQAGIDRQMERALESEAERQLALGVLRYALTSIDDWYAFAREVAREHLT